MKSALTLIFIFTVLISHAQVELNITGDVTDIATGDPLAYATVGVKGHVEQTTTNANGQFELRIAAGAHSDTLIVSYIGYEFFQKRISQLASFEHIRLREYATVLEEVVISDRKFDPRDVDRSMRPIRGNLYAADAEVTNLSYNHFLSSVDGDIRKQYDFDLKKYNKSVKDFYKKYQTPSNKKNVRRRNGYDSLVNFNDFPAVNIPYDGAVEYCRWLTDEYNNHPKKKKFKKVIFRLPTLDEWQIVALGYPKFQTWKLMDNTVDVVIAKDTMNQFKGPRKTMKVDDTILYPWFQIYHMRNHEYNQFGCYLGNFKTTVDRHCVSKALAYDGFTMMSPVRCYFPNDMGFYDVVGNVAEMIDERGKACGGSWNDLAKNSTIQSVKTYKGADETVGFRVFMEVVEK